MPCRIKIKQFAEKLVEDLAKDGLGKRIDIAKRYAQKVNEDLTDYINQYRPANDKIEQLKVLDYQIQGDFLNPVITIPKQLIDHYYELEVQKELQEYKKAENQARLVQKEDARRLGITDKEYTDNYLFDEVTNELNFDRALEAQRDLEIAEKLGEKFREAFNINYYIITPDEAAILLQNSPTPFKSNVSAFFYGDNVYFVKGRFNSSNVIHEFAHPLIKGIAYQNKKLFDNLYAQLDLSDTGRLAKQRVRDNYPELEEDSERFKEESLVTAMEIDAENKLNNIKSDDTLFKQFMDKLIYALKQVIKKLMGREVRLSNLDSSTSLNDLVDMMINKDFVITDLQYQKSLFAEMKKETDDFIKALEKTNAKDFIQIIDDTHSFMKYQLNLLRNSPKKLREELQEEGGLNVIKNIRDYLEPFKTTGLNLTEDDLNNIVTALEQREGDFRTRSLAFINSVNEIDIFTRKVNEVLNNLKENNKHLTVDGIAKVKYFKNLLKGEQDFIRSTIKLLKLDSTNPLIAKLSSINTQLENTIDLTDELTLEFAKEFFIDNTELMAENIVADFKSGALQILNKEGFSEQDIQEFFEDIFDKIDNQRLKNITANQLKLPRIPKGIKTLMDRIQTYTVKRITADTISDYIEGKTEDLGLLTAMFTPTGNMDDLLGSVFRYVRQKLSQTESESYNQLNKMADQLNPLFIAAGVDPTNTTEMKNFFLTVDKVPDINPETNEISEYEIYTFIDKFKNWRYDLAVLENNLVIARKKGNKDDIKTAISALAEFNEKYMHRPYKQVVYDVRKIWNTDNEVYDPSTKQTITVSASVSLDAYIERQKALEKLSVINNNSAWTELDDVLDFTPSKEAQIEYDALYTLTLPNGQYKSGEELQKVLVRRKYRQESSRFYKFETDLNKYQNDLNHFAKVILPAEGITLDENPEEFKRRIDQFIAKTTRISYSAKYFEDKTNILNRIKELQVRSKNNPTVKKLNELYEERFRIVNNVTDKDGQPNGLNLREGSAQRLLEIEEEIIQLQGTFDKKSGLTPKESKRLFYLENYVFKKNSKIIPTQKDIDDFTNLTNKKNELGMSTLEASELRKKYSELNELRDIIPTDYYITALNKALEGTDIEPLTSETVEDFVRNKLAVSEAFEKSEVFKDWFLSNHVVRDVWDQELNNGEGGYDTGYARLKVWSVERPNDESYYKKTKIISPITGKEITVDGAPIAKYTKSYIKDEYRTIPRGKSDDYIGTVIDNRGNYLPREDATDNKYLNKDYYEMKASNSPKFKLLEKLKQNYLEVQKESPYSSRLYLDLARFRQRTTLEYIRSGQGKQEAKDKLTAAKTGLEYIKSIFQKKADDAEVYGFNLEEHMMYVPTDLQGNALSKVPVRGTYKLDIKETSTDVLRAMWDYMYSLNEQRALIKEEPVMNAILDVLSDDANAIKRLDQASSSLLKATNKIKNLAKNTDTDRRVTALLDFINRTFYGKRVSDFQADNPWITKLTSKLMGFSSFAFYSLNPVSSLKNRGGMQFNKLIEVAGGKNINVKTMAQGKFRAAKATWELGTKGYYAKGAKPLDTQIIDSLDLVPGKARTEFGRASTRSFVTDFFDRNWLYSDRKLMEVNASLELGFGMMYHQMVDQIQANGSVTQIPYSEAFELDKDNILKLKEGINPEWGPKAVNHTVSTGETLESLAKKYHMSVEELMAKNKIKKERALSEGEELIIGRSKRFNDFKFKVYDANVRLNGLTNQLDSPLAEKNLLYNTFFFSRRFITGLFLNRFQFDTSKNNLGGDVYNWNTNELTRGFYIDALSAIKKMLKDADYMRHYMTDREKAALKKMLVETAYIITLMLLAAIVFGYDDDDPDRFKKMKEREKDYGLQGWVANHALYQVLMIQKENQLFNPIFGAQDWLDFTKSSTIVVQPTIGSLLKITKDLFYLVTGDESAYYKQDVGPYDWQEKESAKVLNHFLSSLGFTGKNYSPIWAIKKKEQFENLR